VLFFIAKPFDIGLIMESFKLFAVIIFKEFKQLLEIKVFE
jgi:hypothetical protein